MKSKRSVPPGPRNATPETSRPTFEIDLTKRFRAQVRALPKPLRLEVAKAIDAVRVLYGQPHRHSGLSLRKIKSNYYECRVGIDLRLVFRAEPGLLTFTLAGNHEAIHRFAQSL